MWQSCSREPLTDQCENAIRQQHQYDDDEAKRRGMDGEKASHQLLERQQDNGAQ